MAKKSFDLHVCSARVELSIPGALTLKDRRQVVRSILERLKNRYNVSAADLDGGERGASTAALGLACAANSANLAHETIQKAVEFISSDGRAETGNIDILEM